MSQVSALPHARPTLARRCQSFLTVAAVALSSVGTAVAQQSVEARLVTSEPIPIELTSGIRIEARIDRLVGDTVYLSTADGQRLRLMSWNILHGIFDTPSQGGWRPRADQRRPWSGRLMVDLNVARAEYGSEEYRGGAQVKYAHLYRLRENLLLGPTVGVTAMRAGYGETVVPVAASVAYEPLPRLGVAVDLGYGLGVRARPEVINSAGGLHFHPRLTVRAAHPYNPFNVEFGIGYLFQRASFRRFQTERYLTESFAQPGLPGIVTLQIPYQRLSLSATFTFW